MSEQTENIHDLKLKNFLKNKEKLTGYIENSIHIAKNLDIPTWTDTMSLLKKRVLTDTFKIMVLGEFKRGKSTFINAILGDEVLPAYAIPCTAVINEIKYGCKKKAVLYFKNPLPNPLVGPIKEEAIAHINKYKNGNIPPLEIKPEDLESYVVIPDPGKDQKESVAETPYERVELYWPLNLLEKNVEIIDSPGLNEDGTRTGITKNYLSKVDAVIFVMLCDALASASEMDVIDNNVRMLGHEDIFFICNKFDQISQREKERLVNYGLKVLATKTTMKDDGIFFLSARNALDGKIDKDLDKLEQSGILRLEEKLILFLAEQRGKIKLLQPIKELKHIICDEAKNMAKSKLEMLDKSLEDIEKKYNEIKPKLDNLRERRNIIIKDIDNQRYGLKLDVKREAEAMLKNIIEQIPKWVNEAKCKNIAMISLTTIKKQAGDIIKTITEQIQINMQENQREWQRNILIPMVQQRILQISEEVGKEVDEFFINLDNIKTDLSGEVNIEQTKVRNVSWLERLGAVAGSYLVGDIFSAAVGWQFGIGAMAKNLAIQAGVVILAVIAHVTNPLLLVALLFSTSAIQMFMKSTSLTNTIKEKVKEELIKGMKENLYKSADQISEEVFKQTQDFSDIVSIGLEKEINTVQEEMDSIMRDKEQGEEVVKSKKELLKQTDMEIDVVMKGLTDLLMTIAN